MSRRQDLICGCLLGAAAGDALGFCVDDLSKEEIATQFGPEGIQGYAPMNGWALVSSHTQMGLYTANGLLFGATRGATRGRMAPYVQYLDAFYREWGTTQRYNPGGAVGRHYGWVTMVEELRCRRNPDNQTLYALDRKQLGTMAQPVNRSRSPIGLTRAIPIGLFLDPNVMPPEEIRLLGAESAALTVGDPLGFLPAAMLTGILNRSVFGPQDSFRNRMHLVMDEMEAQFGSQFTQMRTLNNMLARAEELSGTSIPVEDVMEALKIESAASVLAAACYVVLKFPGDYDRAICAAVNHSGASAAVGTVVGAMLGASMGTEGIPEFYLEPLEMRDVIEELAYDLFIGCPQSRSHRLFDDQWDQKYVQGTF